MKNLNQIVKHAQKVAVDNAPVLLTAVGVAGTVTTAYLTGKASIKAVEILRLERMERDEQQLQSVTGSASKIPYPNITGLDAVKVVWRAYIPAVAVGCLTCASIIMANRIGMRRAAAMAAAYTISERAYSEYKDKVVEHMGKGKEEKVRDEIAQERVASHPHVKSDIIVTGKGTKLCKDGFSGRYFYSEMETLRRAENDINRQIHNNDFATVSNFYSNIGLEPTSISDELGWNTEKFLDLHISTVLADDTEPCIYMDFAAVPVRDPWQFR